MKPKVSICIPTYKQPKMLHRTLLSIVRQSFDNYEVIITDDSTDCSVQNIVKEFPSNKIKYYKNENRKGAPANWNASVNLAVGDYIKILHHDDWFLDEDSLYKFVEMLDNNPNANFAFCSSSAYDPDEKLLFVHSPSQKERLKLLHNPNCLFFRNIIGAPSATIYRNTHDQEFDLKLKWFVDIEFYIRILRDNSKFIFSSKPLVGITTGNSSQLTTECLTSEKIQIFESVYLYKKLNKKGTHSLRYIKFFWDLLGKYEIKTVQDILDLELDSPIPKLVSTLILLKKL